MEHVREHNRHVDGPESAETHETSFEDEEQDEKENEDKIKRMLQNLEEINRQEKLCTDLIGKELRSWKLKGHCELVELILAWQITIIEPIRSQAV